MKHPVKLYVHIENDLFRANILPAARRANPISRPPVLTGYQQDMWRVMSQDAPVIGMVLKHEAGKPVATDTILADMINRLQASGWGKVETFKCLELDGCWRVIVTIEIKKGPPPP